MCAQDQLVTCANGQWRPWYDGRSCSPQVCVDESQSIAACTSACTTGATQCYSPYGVETCVGGVWGGATFYGCGALGGSAFSCLNGACVQCNATNLSQLEPHLERCSLANASLADVNMGYWDLQRANLSGADLTGADLMGAHLDYANLTGASLTGANLMGAILSNATLTGATLTGVIWGNTTCPDGTNSDSHGGTCP
jgi:hypothetical protein